MAGAVLDFAGDRPETRAKIRLAHEREPILLPGTWIAPEMLNFVRAAMAALPAD